MIIEVERDTASEEVRRARRCSGATCDESGILNILSVPAKDDYWPEKLKKKR